MIRNCDAPTIEIIFDVFIFIKSILVFYIISLFKFLLKCVPDLYLNYWMYVIEYSPIETIEDDVDDMDNDSDGYISDISDSEVDFRNKELYSLNFLIESNVQRSNRYKSKNYCGLYKISTAIVFNYDGKKVSKFTHIKNKLLIWCSFFSKEKLYINDILYLSNYTNNKIAKNTYIFLVLEEKDSGYMYKYLANLSTKKIIPSYKDIMFSKIQIS